MATANLSPRQRALGAWRWSSGEGSSRRLRRCCRVSACSAKATALRAPFSSDSNLSGPRRLPAAHLPHQGVSQASCRGRLEERLRHGFAMAWPVNVRSHRPHADQGVPGSVIVPPSAWSLAPLNARPGISGRSLAGPSPSAPSFRFVVNASRDLDGRDEITIPKTLFSLCNRWSSSYHGLAGADRRVREGLGRARSARRRSTAETEEGS